MPLLPSKNHSFSSIVFKAFVEKNISHINIDICYTFKTPLQFHIMIAIFKKENISHGQFTRGSISHHFSPNRIISLIRQAYMYYLFHHCPPIPATHLPSKQSPAVHFFYLPLYHIYHDMTGFLTTFQKHSYYFLSRINQIKQHVIK